MPSSVIKKIEYQDDSRRLRITFVSGDIYDYLNVPKAVFEEMRASGSKGAFLNALVKGRYDFEKVK
jgi:KTSC domain